MTALIKRRRTKLLWSDPKESIGEVQGRFEDKYTCWRPVGRALRTWAVVGPDIKEYLDNFCRASSTTGYAGDVHGRQDRGGSFADYPRILAR